MNWTAPTSPNPVTGGASPAGQHPNPNDGSYFVQYDHRGVLPGFVLSPERRATVEAAVGRTYDPRVWNLHLTGRNVLVALDSADEKYGVLYLPRSSVEREQQSMGGGWVVAVGPLAGVHNNSFKQGVITRTPQALLGCHVYFEAMAGRTFRTSKEDTEFSGSLMVMDSNDLFALDGESR